MTQKTFSGLSLTLGRWQKTLIWCNCRHWPLLWQSLGLRIHAQKKTTTVHCNFSQFPTASLQCQVPKIVRPPEVLARIVRPCCITSFHWTASWPQHLLHFWPSLAWPWHWSSCSDPPSRCSTAHVPYSSSLQGWSARKPSASWRCRASTRTAAVFYLVEHVLDGLLTIHPHGGNLLRGVRVGLRKPRKSSQARPEVYITLCFLQAQRRHTLGDCGATLKQETCITSSSMAIFLVSVCPGPVPQAMPRCNGSRTRLGCQGELQDPSLLVQRKAPRGSKHVEQSCQCPDVCDRSQRLTSTRRHDSPIPDTPHWPNLCLDPHGLALPCQWELWMPCLFLFAGNQWRATENLQQCKRRSVSTLRDRAKMFF